MFNLFQTFVLGATTLGAVVLRNTSAAGDYIELYAYQDLLAVQNVCGDDLGMASTYSYKSIRVVVSEALPEYADTATAVLVAFRRLRLGAVSCRTTYPGSGSGDPEGRRRKRTTPVC